MSLFLRDSICEKLVPDCCDTADDAIDVRCCKYVEVLFMRAFFCQILRENASLSAIWDDLLESQMKNALAKLGKFAEPIVPSWRRKRGARCRRKNAHAHEEQALRVSHMT